MRFSEPAGDELLFIVLPAQLLFRICDTSGNINIHAAVNDVHDELLSSVLPPPICLRMTPTFSRWGITI
ncbi:hypothetical protein G5714_023539 [Onychostoma macrolepis]|uniref:Uncharacterized protein n=1 Tax=Onychostoma macrolepis TaxID=369639 RepID=A0A7J6BLY2_9TELE|nr:hypothetical protein G5714_023539 [Onychostoma macrolepis]